jgi:hypothetical protein
MNTIIKTGSINLTGDGERLNNQSTRCFEKIIQIMQTRNGPDRCVKDAWKIKELGVTAYTKCSFERKHPYVELTSVLGKN